MASLWVCSTVTALCCSTQCTSLVEEEDACSVVAEGILIPAGHLLHWQEDLQLHLVLLHPSVHDNLLLCCSHPAPLTWQARQPPAPQQHHLG